MSEHCPTCGSKVDVHHGLEGTSHYRPVEHDLRARLEKAEEALRQIDLALTTAEGDNIPEAYGSVLGARLLAREALASLDSAHPEEPAE